jgi:hypothetical protein
MSHPAYWKVKAIVVEAQLIHAQAQATVAAAQQRQMKALTEAGLDPSVDYEFRDEDESITPQEAHTA